MGAAEAGDGAEGAAIAGGGAAGGGIAGGGAADGIIAGGGAGKRGTTTVARQSSSTCRMARSRMAGARERLILHASTVRRPRFAACLPFAIHITLVASTQAALPMEADLAKATREFRTYCAACHGSDGRGNGPAAKALKQRPPDLTKLARRAGGSFPSEVVFRKIEGLNMPAAHGTSKMPVWGQRFVEQELGDGVLLEDARNAAKATNRRINGLLKYLEAIQE